MKQSDCLEVALAWRDLRATCHISYPFQLLTPRLEVSQSTVHSSHVKKYIRVKLSQQLKSSQASDATSPYPTPAEANICDDDRDVATAGPSKNLNHVLAAATFNFALLNLASPGGIHTRMYVLVVNFVTNMLNVGPILYSNSENCSALRGVPVNFEHVCFQLLRMLLMRSKRSP